MVLKTQRTEASVAAFLEAVQDEGRRDDCRAVAAMMEEGTGAQPKMWGPSIVGFGSSHYRYASGREGDWFIMGFSPRKRDLTLYLSPGVERYPEILSRLGKYSTGKSCLYIKRLADVDVGVLRELISAAAKHSPGSAMADPST